MIENRAFITWNPIDEYVWAEDSNFQFQKIKSEYYSNSIIHKELLENKKRIFHENTIANLKSSKWYPNNG